MKNQSFYLLILCLASLATNAAILDQAISDQAISDQNFDYAVSHNNIRVGVLGVSVRSEDDGYVVTSTSKFKTWVRRLFKVKDHIVLARFAQHQNRMVLVSGKKKQKDGDLEEGFHMNYGQHLIEFSNGEQTKIAPDDRFESVVFPLLLIARLQKEPRESLAETVVWEVNSHHAREYIYEKPVEETVRVPAGEFCAWKVNRRRIDKKGNHVTTWLHRTDTSIPLKFEIANKGKITTLELQKTPISAKSCNS